MKPWPLPDASLAFEDESVRLTPTDPARDGEALWKAADPAVNGEDLFLYHPGVGPFTEPGPFLAVVSKRVADTKGLTYTVFSKRLGAVVGGLSLLNVRADHGTVEVGSIWYAKAAQRSEVNTHAVYLLMRYVLEDLGYRRFEWKCHRLNLPSRRAAVRLGFREEGTFRQHFWDKGTNRDTVWFSIIDREWPLVKDRFESRLLAGLPPGRDRSADPAQVLVPLFYNLTGKRVLVVGGGGAGWQKVKALAPFGVPMTVVSPAFAPDLADRASVDPNLTLVTKEWDEGDLDGTVPVGLVLACTGDRAVQAAVVAAARHRGIPVLDAALPGQGDFVQPATHRAGTYTLAVSSGGTGPRGAVNVRDALVDAFEAAVAQQSS